MISSLIPAKTMLRLLEKARSSSIYTVSFVAKRLFPLPRRGTVSYVTVVTHNSLWSNFVNCSDALWHVCYGAPTVNLFHRTNSCKHSKHKRIPPSISLLKLNYFLLRFLVGSCNRNLKSSTLAPSEFSLINFFPHWKYDLAAKKWSYGVFI